MRVLFVGVNDSGITADEHRVRCLAEWLSNLGVHVDKQPMGATGAFFNGIKARQVKYRWRKMPWHKYDYYHVASSMAAVMLAKQRKSGAKIVFDCQGLRHAEIAPRMRGLKKLCVPIIRGIERRAARLSDLVITVSNPLKDWLAEARGTAEGIEIIRNGVDKELFREVSDKKVARADEALLVGYAGGFQDWQAVDILMDVGAKLKGRSDIRWRIIGFKESDSEIKRRFAEQLPAGSELLDRCDQQTLVGLLAECDLLAIPRKPYLACEVALPTKFAEYLSMAKPVLVNNVDETGEITRKCGCGFVADSNADSMAEAICRAADVPRPQLLQMGKSGQVFMAEHLSWDVVGPRYKKFLDANM